MVNVLNFHENVTTKHIRISLLLDKLKGLQWTAVMVVNTLHTDIHTCSLKDRKKVNTKDLETFGTDEPITYRSLHVFEGQEIRNSEGIITMSIKRAKIISLVLHKDAHNLHCQHFAEFFFSQTCCHKLPFSDLPVTISIHLREGTFCHHRLRLNIRFLTLH